MQQQQTSARNSSPLPVVGLLLAALGGFIFLGVPAIQSFWMSFMEYSPAGGLFNSLWIGLENYQRLFSTYQFALLAGNSFIAGFGGGILPVLLGGAVGLILAKISRPGKISAVMIACWLLPVFLPESAYGVLAGFRGGAEILAFPDKSRLLFLLISGFRWFCFTVFLSGICGLIAKHRGFALIKGWLGGSGAATALLLARSFSPSMELLLMLQNPLNYETMETLDTYQYKSGLMMAQYSFSAAAWVSKLLMQLPGLLIAAVLIFLLLRNRVQPNPAQNPASGTPVLAVAGGVLAVLLTLGIWVWFSTIPTGTASSVEIVGYFVNSLIVSVFSSVLFAILLALFLAACCRLPRIAAILGLFLIGLLYNPIGSFMFYRELGVVNTHVSMVLSVCWSGVVLFVPAAAIGWVSGCGEQDFGKNFRRVLPFFFLFLGLFVAESWGGWLEGTILVADSSKYTLSIVLRQLLGMAQEWPAFTPVLLLYGILPLLVGVISVVLFGVLFSKNENQ